MHNNKGKIINEINQNDYLKKFIRNKNTSSILWKKYLLVFIIKNKYVYLFILFRKGNLFMENEEVKVVDQSKTEEKPAEEKKVEAPAKAAPKKRGPKAKSTAKKPVKKTVAKKKEAAAEVKKDDVKAPVEKKAPAKRGPKKAAKTTAKTATKAAAKAVPETKFDFAKTTFEYDGKKFTAESINAKVLEYLNKHPYISANVIETFVNIGEKKIYFTVDGFGNADFTIDL